jgi:hypothetical protein
MPYSSSIKEEEEKNDLYLGFSRGVNSLQDPTLVSDKNIIKGDNVMLVVDGITRRFGSSKVWDEGGGSKVYGAMGFYKKTDSTKKFIRISNGKLQYKNGTVWTDISGASYTNIKTSFVQVTNKAFIHNGTDALTYYDGSTITTYSTITTPTNLTVTPRFTNVYAITSITRSSQIATVTTTSAHNRATGDYITISGAAQAEYNITAQITVTSLTTFTYTVSGSPATPATGTCIATDGGVTVYSYRVEAFNSTGNSIACARVQITNGAEILNATNFNELSWTAVAGATGYNIFGRTPTGTTEAFMNTVDVLTYTDTGVDTPLVLKLPSEVNTSGGIKAKSAIIALNRQFAFGVTEGTTYYPTRLYYSGIVNHIDDFTSSSLGGGWVPVGDNDGGEIVALIPYQSGLLVFKTNGIFYFYFSTTGVPSLKDITRSYGGTSIDCVQAIDNNIIVVGQKENRIGVWTVGTQANYGSDEIRTNELTVFIKGDLENVNRVYLSNIATFTFNNMFGFTYTSGSDTENSEGWVFDTQFGSWVHWTGLPMQVTHYVTYDDGTNVKLYGCSNSDGYMIELMKTQRNDNGDSFKSIIGTKFYNQGLFDVDKIFRNPVLWWKFIQPGLVNVNVWFDGDQFGGSAPLLGVSSGSGTGIDLMGSTLPGDSYSSITQTKATSEVIQELTLMQMARSIGFYLIDESYNSNWIFMGIDLPYTVLQGKPAEDLQRIAIS